MVNPVKGFFLIQEEKGSFQVLVVGQLDEIAEEVYGVIYLATIDSCLGFVNNGRENQFQAISESFRKNLDVHV